MSQMNYLGIQVKGNDLNLNWTSNLMLKNVDAEVLSYKMKQLELLKIIE